MCGGPQSLAWGSDADAAMQQAIVRWTIALPYALKAHCWKRRELSRDLGVSFKPYEGVVHAVVYRPAWAGH